jgi:hypothetical protein
MMDVSFFGCAPKMKKQAEQLFCWCPVRKKWLVLTPEEWVRQNWINYLHKKRKYPLGLIVAEKAVTINSQLRRFDVVVYDQLGTPQILIECKQDTVTLNNKVIQQVLAYQSILKATAIIISNGVQHYGFSWQNGQIASLINVPNFG